MTPRHGSARQQPGRAGREEPARQARHQAACRQAKNRRSRPIQSAPSFIAIGPSEMGANAISVGPEFAPVSDAPSCRRNLLMAWRQEVAGRLRSCRPPSSCEAVALSQAPFLPLAAVLGAAGLASALGTAAALGAAGFVSAGLGAAALGDSAGWTAAGLTGAALAAGAA